MIRGWQMGIYASIAAVQHSEFINICVRTRAWLGTSWLKPWGATGRWLEATVQNGTLNSFPPGMRHLSIQRSLIPKHLCSTLLKTRQPSNSARLHHRTLTSLLWHLFWFYQPLSTNCSTKIHAIGGPLCLRGAFLSGVTLVAAWIWVYFPACASKQCCALRFAPSLWFHGLQSSLKCCLTMAFAGDFQWLFSLHSSLSRSDYICLKKK